MKVIIQYLEGICRKHPFSEKILIVDNFTVGEQIINSFVKAGNEVVNLKTTTVLELAKDLMELYSEEPYEFVEKNVAVQLMYSILRDMKNEGAFKYFIDLEITPTFSRAVFETIKKLRLAGFTSEVIRKDAFITAEKGEDLYQILKKYENILSSQSLKDEADLLRNAMQVAKYNKKAVFILQSNLSISYLEEMLLNSMLSDSSYKLPLTKVLGVPTPSHTSLRSIAWGESSCYSFLYDLENASVPTELTLYSGKTEELEIKAVFQQIREKKYPFDKCIVFYTATEPYNTSVYLLSQKLNIPVTYGEGIPISFTSPGRFVKSLLNWVRDHYSVKAFVQLINDGDLSLEEGAPSKTRMIRLLRDAKIGWDKSRYLNQLEKTYLQLNRKLQEGTDNSYKEYIEQRRNQVVWLQQWFRRIFKRLPDIGETLNTKELLEGIEYMVKNYCHTKSPQDEMAKTNILENVEKLKPYTNEILNSYDVFEKVTEMLLRVSVNQSSPKAGHLHVTNYKKGVYNDRENVFIVGLDNRKFPGDSTEDPLLLDQERRILGNGLNLLKDKGLEKQYTMLQVIANSQGPVSVSYCSFDINNNRSVSPAHLFLQCFRMKTNNAQADFEDISNSSVIEKVTDIMDKKDYWENQLTCEGVSKLDERIIDSYENLPIGIQAEEARSDGKFTVHDGLVEVDEAIFDPRVNKKQTMSAGKLEKLAQCPYAYFLENVLNIRPVEDMTFDPNTWLDAATRGSLLHSIFETFYKQLIDKKEKPSLSMHEEVIRSIAQNLILKQKEIIPPPNERVFQKEVNNILQCCKIFLKEEEEHCQDYDPQHFEYTFGMEDISPAEITLPSGDSFYVSGKIDRVDKSSNGYYHIIDYKTGSTYNYHDKQPYKGGRQLQHFIYALAIEQHLRLGEGSVLESSYYFPTVNGLGERYTRQQDETLRVNGFDILERLVDVIKHGHFTMTDEENDCKFCDFQSICRRSMYDNNILNTKQMAENAEGVRKFKGVRAYD